MFVITGASGRLGSRIAHRVLDRVPAEQVAVSVRDPASAADLAARGARVRTGDFTAPDTLDHAFEGATRVLVVSAAIAGPEGADANAAAIDAAVRAGAERVVYTSHQAASSESLFGAMPTHAATEAHLAASGVPFTALRNGFYVSTFEHYLPAAVEAGRLVVPEDGPVSWTGHDDLADAAAAALVDGPEVAGVSLDGPTPPLTAAGTLTFAEAAALVGVEHVVVADEEWLATMADRGMPAGMAEFSLGMFRAARRGEFDVVDPTLETVLGRTPASAETAVTAMT